MTNTVLLTNWVHPQITDFLQNHCEVIANPDRTSPLTREQIIEKGQNAKAMMAFMPDMVDADFLERMPNLKLVAGALKGFDNFDIKAMKEREVALTFVPDLLTVPTAELAICLLIGLARNVLAGDDVIRSGNFQGWRATLYGCGLQNAVIGIIGMGAIGQAMAKRISSFEADLRYTDHQRLDETQEEQLNLSWQSFEEVLTASDYVIIATPLTDGTKHLIGADTLKLLKPSAFLINPARGSVVDEEAVADALENGTLSGYAADVFEMEDWARLDRPLNIPQRLLDMRDKTLFTPHLGSAVDQVRVDIAMTAARNIVQFFKGEQPKNLITL